MAVTKQVRLFRVEGDTKPDIVAEFEGFDLTGYAIDLNVVRLNDKCRFTKAGIIDDAPAGKFHFEFVAGDLILERGNYEAEIEFTIGSDNFTLPREYGFLIDVRADIL